MKHLPIYLMIMMMQMILETRSAADEDFYKILRFGTTTGDYIRFRPNMQPFSAELSVCSWVKKLMSGGDRHWFGYGTSGDTNEMLIRDDGSNNYMFGNGANTKVQAGISIGVWYHFCMCWSLSSRTATIYHNGRQTGSFTTPSGRRLGLNGYFVLGQEQDSNGGGFDSSQLFGGDLHKMNVFSKKLDSSEVSEMYSSGRCSDVETKYDETRQMKWETIMQQPRTGNVRVEIDTSCLLQLLRKELSETRKELDATQSELKSTQTGKEEISNQLNRKSDELKEVYESLEKTEKRLNQTLESVKETKNSLSQSETLAASLSSKLNLTKVELGLTKGELEVAVRELEELKEGITKENCFRTTNSTHWDLLYTRSYFNTVLTEESLGRLTNYWRKLEYFKGMTVTEGLIEFLKTFHSD